MQQPGHCTIPSPIDVTIPMMDPAPLHHELQAELAAAIEDVIHRGDFVLGKAVSIFEENAASWLGVRHAIGVGSGTEALMLALRAAGVGAGDDVITTSFSFWATVEAIHHVGARPVFVDIARDDMNIDATRIEAVITPATRAILPVHLFGQCADMNTINTIARKNDLVVIEDAAQAFGAALGKRKAGSFGLAGCFSFHPAKTLGAFGDGGLVVTDDPVVARAVRELRNHGAGAHHHHSAFGYNSRLDSLQAAVLGVKLKHLDAHLAERRRLASEYTRLLKDEALTLPQVLPEREHAFALYTVLTDKRDRLQERLREAGVASAVHYPMPLYRQPAWENEYGDMRLPVAESVSERCLSLPLYYGLDAQRRQRVVAVIRDSTRCS
ncbi:MAG: DegT/DnrJ/EryC1/StrS family aminotransferase [Proteobacteria bacterium]|nr:DegT/DnrJ/EryC1/StrS family aminotransferase [Pseudomonadota bacterium]